MPNRRTLITQALLAAGLTTLGGNAWSQALTMRISHAANEADWLHKSLLMFKEKVEAALPGQIAVQVHGASSLFRQSTEVPALQRGNLEMSTMTTFEVEQQMPEYGVFSSGYLFRDYPHLAKVMRGPIGKEYYDAVAAKMGIQIIEVCYLGTRQVNLRTYRDVKVPADLNGVKLRMPASKEWLFLGEALGATPTPMAFGEVYLGLKTGVIDGQDNPLPTVRAAKFYEVMKQIVMTSHLIDGVFIALSNKSWNAMNAAQKKNVQAAAHAAVIYNNENRIKEESQLVDFFKKEGLQITTPDVDAFRKHVQAAYQNSDYAKVWPKGLLERINAVK